MAKRKTLEEKIAEDLAKLNEEKTESTEDIIDDINNSLNLPEPEINIWADLTISDEEPKENKNAAELKYDDFSSVQTIGISDFINDQPKPTTYKINEDKDSGLNIPTVTAPVQKTKSNSRSAIKGVYCLNGKIGRN